MPTRCSTGESYFVKDGWASASQLLPVKVEAERATEPVKRNVQTLSSGTMEIEFPKGTLRIAGSVDVAALRAVLESLAR
jgi:hypothetical protein